MTRDSRAELLDEVPETKTVKNRLHVDVHASGGRAVPIETRSQRVDAEARWSAPRTAPIGVITAAVPHAKTPVISPEALPAHQSETEIRLS